MNYKKLAVLGFLSFVGINQTLEAQILRKVKQKVQETAENRVINKAGEASNKGLDKVEDATRSQKNESETQEEPKKEQASKEQTTKPGDLQAFKNYDFVPGDKLIFYYDMAGETDAEIPGRMLINTGNAEVQTYRGEKVLLAPVNGELTMMPYMKSNSYLPEQFTVEFDILANGGVNTSSDVSEIRIYFKSEDAAGNGSAVAPVLIRLEAASGAEPYPSYGFETYKENGNATGTHSRPFPSEAINSTQDNWRHVAIYFNKNIGKLYLDQHRLGVLNQVEPERINLIEIEVYGNAVHPVLFKNFKIAEGGDDTYKKIISDGKFIAYGIQFDVNKADLKPESMGTINRFLKMMQENPNLKFEIGGHTDSDGSDATNKNLSQKRAESVRNQLIQLGIAAERLTAKGYGATKPVVANDSFENKARNRRVEFVKQ